MTEKKQQLSPEWFEARRGRITGSMVGAILDIAPYMTRDQALRSMVRSYHKAESEFKGNIATEWGNANEDGARWEYELETGNTVKPAFFDTLEDWLGASPDGYIGDGGLLEIKCPFGIRNNGKFKTLADQPHYYAQIQVQLHVTGRKWCDFFQWTPHGTNLERVEIDQSWLDENLPVLRQFYAFYLSELDNPEHLEPLRVDLGCMDAKRIVDEIDQLKEAQDNAKERQKELEATLVRMAKGKNATVWGKKLTLVSRSGSISYAKAIKELAPNADLEKWRGKETSFWKLS